VLTTVYAIHDIKTRQLVRVALSGSPEAQVTSGEVGLHRSLAGWDSELIPIEERRTHLREYRAAVRRLDDEAIMRQLLADADDIAAEMDRRAVEAEAKFQRRATLEKLEIDRRKADAANRLARAAYERLSTAQRAGYDGIGGVRD